VEKRHWRSGKTESKFQKKATLLPGKSDLYFLGDFDEAQAVVTPTE
jgi:hypothetical protein